MIIYKSYRQSCDGLIPVIHHFPLSLHLYYASFLNLIAKLGMPDLRQFVLPWPSARYSVLCTDINCYKTHKPLSNNMCWVHFDNPSYVSAFH